MAQYVTHFEEKTVKEIATRIRECQQKGERVVSVAAYATEGPLKGFGYDPRHHAIVVYEV